MRVTIVSAGAWCDTCRALEQTVLTDERVASLLAGSFVVQRIDEYDVEAAQIGDAPLPLVVISDAAGRELERVSGRVAARDLEARLVRARSGRLEAPTVDGADDGGTTDDGAAPASAGAETTSDDGAATADAAETTADSGAAVTTAADAAAGAATAAVDPLAEAVFLVGDGLLWNGGGGRWFAQSAGLPGMLVEQERDEQFQYVRADGGSAVLAIALDGSAIWRWDRTAQTWLEMAELERID